MSSGSSCIAIPNEEDIKAKSSKTDSKLVLAVSERRRVQGVTDKGHGVSCWGNENGLKLVCYTKYKYAKNGEFYGV